MTRQNINLIAALNIQDASVLDAKLIAQIVGSWILLLVLVYFIMVNIEAHKQKKLNILTLEQNNLQRKFDDLDKKTLTANSIELVDLTKKLPLGSVNTQGFFSYLDDLAVTIPENVWLSDIILSQADDSVLLRGKSISARQASLFFELLNTTQSFKDKKFNQLNLQAASSKGDISFIISAGAVTISSITATTPKEVK